MLKFNRETKWGDFLDAYLDATQRKPGFEQGAVTGLPTATLPEEVLPVRRSPPFGKGGESIAARIKNHPATLLPNEARPVRRSPPFGKGGDRTKGSIKNHPSAYAGDESLPRNP